MKTGKLVSGSDLVSTTDQTAPDDMFSDFIDSMTC